MAAVRAGFSVIYIDPSMRICKRGIDASHRDKEEEEEEVVVDLIYDYIYIPLGFHDPSHGKRQHPPSAS